ncbi:MAG: hypothetical protein P4L45_06735 [Ignavibacteriaceae bacterium]|nr:hypothetical protein [Ignavibacteriaceae bacterium]
MDIYQTIELIQTKLEEDSTNSGGILYGINIITDPHSDLTKYVPFVLLEAEKTGFVNSAQGFVIGQEHYITLTCIVSAQNSSFDKYKSEVNSLAENVIDKINTITDYKIQKIIPVEQTHCEIMLGALKSTAIIISVKVQTYWKDE